MPSRRLLALVGVLVVASVLVGTAGAAPPPRPVCAACDAPLEERADYYGLDVTVTDSNATVTVHENGTATWVVRNAIREDRTLDRLRENATLRRAVAEGRYWDAELQSATVSDGALRTRYRDPGFAVASVRGTLRSAVFTEAYGYRNLHGLGADRLTVVAPDGMRVDSAVPGAAVSEDGSRMVLTAYDRGGFVTFVPRDATLGALWSWLAIVDLVGAVVLVNAGVAAAVPAAVVAGLVGTLGGPAVRSEAAPDRIRADPGRALLVGGTVAAVAALVGDFVGLTGATGLPLLGVGAAALALGAFLRFGPVERPTFPQVAVGALAATGIAVAVATATGLALSGRVPWAGIRPTLLSLVGLFAFAPAGYALGRGRRRRAVLTAAAGVAVAGLLTVPLAVPVRIFSLSSRFLTAATGAVALAVVGVPFLLVGAGLAHTGADTAS